MAKKENDISIKRIIENAFFMIKYAARYDKPLITRIMVLFILSKAGKAINDTFILKMIIDGLTGKAEFSSLIVLLLISLVLVVCLEWINQLIDEWSKAKLIKLSGTIQRDLIENNSKMDLIYYDDPEYYNTYVIVAGNADTAIEQTVMVVSRTIGGVVALGIASAMIFTIDPVLAVFPIAGFTVNLLTRFKIEKLQYNWDVANKTAIRKANYSQRVFYQPEYAKECKLTDVKVPLRQQFDDALDEATAAGRKYGPKLTWISLLNWISVFTVFSFFAIPAYLGYLALVLRKIALGDVASGNNASNYIRSNLNEINFCLVDFQQIGQYAEKFRQMLDYKPVIEKADGLAPDSGAAAITLENVSFRYPHSDKDTLSNINLEIKPGEKIAIVGENGAGKTTFVKLLMRLYDQTSGRITYHDKDVATLCPREYHKRIGVVFQDYQMFGANLAENVVMDNLTKEEIEAQSSKITGALTAAGFENKLNHLPDRLFTQVTTEFDTKGVDFSGGESQKVAISRAFYKNADILIMDEPSSAPTRLPNTN